MALDLGDPHGGEIFSRRRPSSDTVRSMLRDPKYTRDRFAQTAQRLATHIHAETLPVDSIVVSPRVERITLEEARALPYRPAEIGERFGPLWATYWFRVGATVPGEWAGRRVDLLWVTGSESTLWIEGRSAQGFHPERRDATLTERARGGERLELEVELACNGLFGEHGFAGVTLERCEIAVFDPEAAKLYHDFLVLQELEADAENGLDPSFAGLLLDELNRFCNVWDEDDRSTWPRAAEILAGLYGHANARFVHELSAIGHAHIDTAWLWPIAETYRKCVRTFSSQVVNMERYPEFRFACSQAQHYAWIKERNPDLYARIVEKVESGGWVPVGATWVEPDCNLPSGESLVRQFLHGQRFFERELGGRCREFWSPDAFGYNGQLPQIMRLAGATRFLTQKLSWNRFNPPEHHTFVWQGLDGSEVLAHFPPADTYNASAEVAELRRNAHAYKQHDRSRTSLLVFGYGDGGGGPTPRMIESLSRARDLQGLPRTTMRSSDEFYSLLEAETDEWPVVVGELYFEYHRGTYTTHAGLKRANRRSEALLHDVEFLAALAHRLGRGDYPREPLRRLWQKLLTNQFHDILPGSSIRLVYEDAEREYEEIAAGGGVLLVSALEALGSGGEPVPVNTVGVARREVVASPDGGFAVVEAPSYGAGRVVEPDDEVRVEETAGGFLLENAHLRVELRRDGTVASLVEKQSGREALAAPGNRLQLYDDRPTAFDAWDVDPFHLETVRDCPPADSCRLLTSSPLRAEVELEGRIGAASTVRQVVRLDADARRLEFHTEVDWREHHRMLKVLFPVAVRALTATYEMQFGYAERPTHFSTSYDRARFEVPGHRFADVSEHGFGVAVLTDSKYGYSTLGNELRISLLRSPKMPDPEADMGAHRFAYAVLPHAGGWREGGVVAEGLRFNAPLLWAPGPLEPRRFAEVDDPNLLLDTIKLAEDSDALVLRLYEAHGGRGVAGLRLGVPFTEAAFANVLEDDGEPARVEGDTIAVPYRPHEIVTLKVR